MKGITDTIEQALSAAGLMQRCEAVNARGMTIDATAHEVHARTEDLVAIASNSPECKEHDAATECKSPSSPTGEFLERSFASAGGSRIYKVYLPAQYSDAAQPVPMVVMLHGCTQSPDDFAAGTRMNALADELGFVVVYPAQSAAANAQKCWNWFRAEDQVRESGEPAIVAGITREVALRYRIDERRIFVAGLSAGAAMAVILGATYPDLYAAVGAHSGLPYRAASDMPSAFGAMHGGSGRRHSEARSQTALPTIVFHGDSDRTVSARNGAAIVEQGTQAHDGQTILTDARTGTAAGGLRYRRTEYKDASDRIIVEQWTLHGAGHAWSGGSAAGSFTDARGPDASKEMIRFFYSLPRSGTA